MSPRRRRLFAAVLALAAMAGVVAMQQGTPAQHTFRVTLGLADKTPSDWSGRVAVAGGEVVDLTGWRFENPDKVTDKSGWTCRTRNNIAPEYRYPVFSPHGKAKSPTCNRGPTASP